MNESQAKTYLYLTLGDLYLKVGRGFLAEPSTNNSDFDKKRSLIAFGFIEAGFNLREVVDLEKK